MTKTRTILRSATVAAVLLAGAARRRYSDLNARSNDGAMNHPSWWSRDMSRSSCLSRRSGRALARRHGQASPPSSPSISSTAMARFRSAAPAGPSSGAAISYFAERLAWRACRADASWWARATPRTAIRAWRSAISAIMRIPMPCGDWSQDVSDTASESTTPNFGCAVQQNIAAKVSRSARSGCAAADGRQRCLTPQNGAGQI